MCDPVTLGLAVGASVGGKMLTANNQAAQAAAANQQLAKNIGTLNNYGASNEKALGTDLSGYSPTNQAQALTDAQNARSNSSAGNISDPAAAGMNDIPVGDAPPAVKSEIAKRMLGVHDAAVARAKALGKLGGYGDVWFENQLRNQAAGRDISTTNNLADTLKPLIGTESQLAGNTVASPLGSYVSGLGSILGSYAGGGGNLGTSAFNVLSGQGSGPLIGLYGT